MIMAKMGRPATPAYEAARREQAIYGIPEYVFKAWNAQRYSAERRGIPWRFGLFAWDQWWRRELLALGPEAKRGRRKGQYVMARFADLGAYEHGNVYAATSQQNQLDIPDDVRARRFEKGTATAVARGHPRGYHLRLGNPHPCGKPVVTDKGTFLSIRLAAQAHGVSERTGRTRLRKGEWEPV